MKIYIRLSTTNLIIVDPLETYSIILIFLAQIDWTQFFQSAFSQANITITPSHTVWMVFIIIDYSIENPFDIIFCWID